MYDNTDQIIKEISEKAYLTMIVNMQTGIKFNSIKFNGKNDLICAHKKKNNECCD